MLVSQCWRISSSSEINSFMFQQCCKESLRRFSHQPQSDEAMTSSMWYDCNVFHCILHKFSCHLKNTIHSTQKMSFDMRDLWHRIIVLLLCEHEQNHMHFLWHCRWFWGWWWIHVAYVSTGDWIVEAFMMTNMPKYVQLLRWSFRNMHLTKNNHI